MPHPDRQRSTVPIASGTSFPLAADAEEASELRIIRQKFTELADRFTELRASRRVAEEHAEKLAIEMEAMRDQERATHKSSLVISLQCGEAKGFVRGLLHEQGGYAGAVREQRQYKLLKRKEPGGDVSGSLKASPAPQYSGCILNMNERFRERIYTALAAEELDGDQEIRDYLSKYGLDGLKSVLASVTPQTAGYLSALEEWFKYLSAWTI